MCLPLVGLASNLGAINFIVTIRNMRAPGMGWFKMPLFVWAMLATAIIALIATPFLSGGLTLMLLDRLAGEGFFPPPTRRDPPPLPHRFLVFSPPAAHIFVLPPT